MRKPQLNAVLTGLLEVTNIMTLNLKSIASVANNQEIDLAHTGRESNLRHQNSENGSLITEPKESPIH